MKRSFLNIIQKSNKPVLQREEQGLYSYIMVPLLEMSLEEKIIEAIAA
jgi:hypothetical protein